MSYATTTEMRTGIGWLDAAARLLDRMTGLLSVFGTLGILAIMVLIVADIVMRLFFSAPIMGVPEIVSMLILSIVFLQLPNALAHGKITRAALLLDRLDVTRPRIRLILDGALHMIGATVMAVLVSAFYPLFIRAYERQEMVGTYGQFLAPVWPSYLVVLIGAVLMCAVFVQRAVCLWVLAAKGDPA
ncbi:TRAP transporter small permease subunit [Paracoccus aerodenitrificans]|uniref:TRAP transporter small permease subunit n=1 Tax=Paracoccus aerodenitrificans TaxID=3017781 RepID=UPI0022F0FE47|nr:TRAP transporter small permease [Paracoccus aerodenitrificans]WBU63552.1 TRAP transporter small permease [Paracoccus aerodenitrificans]